MYCQFPKSWLIHYWLIHSLLWCLRFRKVRTLCKLWYTSKRIKCYNIHCNKHYCFVYVSWILSLHQITCKYLHKYYYSYQNVSLEVKSLCSIITSFNRVSLKTSLSHMWILWYNLLLKYHLLLSLRDKICVRRRPNTFHSDSSFLLCFFYLFTPVELVFGYLTTREANVELFNLKSLPKHADFSGNETQEPYIQDRGAGQY